MTRMTRGIVFAIAGLTGIAVAQGSASAQYYYGVDHLTCYKVKDSQKVLGTATLQPLLMERSIGIPVAGFGAEGCTVSKAKLLCVPSTKSVSSLQVNKIPTLPLPLVATDAREARICYKVKCSNSSVGAVLPFADQFGVRNLTLGKTGYVCTPAMEESVIPGYCGDGLLNGFEECDPGAPGAPCSNGVCEQDCRCHQAYACCYAESLTPPLEGCIQYFGTQTGASNFIGSCGSLTIFPGLLTTTGLPGGCTAGPVSGIPCGGTNTLYATGTP